MSKIIATDLDGTFLYPKRKFFLVDKRYKKIINRYPGEIVFATGRGDRFCRRINRLLDVKENYICFNGALVIRDGEIIFRHSLRKVALTHLYNYVLENYSGIHFYLFDNKNRIVLSGNTSKYLMYKSYIKRIFRSGRYSEFFNISQKLTNSLLRDETSIYKAMIYVDKNLENIYYDLIKNFGEYFNFYLSLSSIEISPKGVSKGTALEFLIKEMGIDKSDVLVVGNDQNDLPLFEMFENSFAIRNSEGLIKNKAKYVINDFAEIEKHL